MTFLWKMVILGPALRTPNRDKILQKCGKWGLQNSLISRSPVGSGFSLIWAKKRFKNEVKTHGKLAPDWMQKMKWILINFPMNFQSFFGVIFVTFFDTAFSNKGCCCKVRHARILWFLQWILTIFKFYVFLERTKKAAILARIAMQKT